MERAGTQFKEGDVICLPQAVQAGKGQTVTIESGRYEVTNAQPNKRTGDPQVRLRTTADPDARRTPWVGERKLLESGAAIAQPEASC